MSEEPRTKSAASRCALWSSMVVVAYILSVGPMTVLGQHLGFGATSWNTLRAIYRPLHFVSMYPPFFSLMSRYTCWWADATNLSEPYVQVIWCDPN
jgi:hypothetical protein